MSDRTGREGSGEIVPAAKASAVPAAAAAAEAAAAMAARRERRRRRGRRRLERDRDLREQGEVLAALDVRMRQGFGELQRPGQTLAAALKTEARRRGGFAARSVVFPCRAEVVEPVDRGALQESRRARQGLNP